MCNTFYVYCNNCIILYFKCLLRKVKKPLYVSKYNTKNSRFHFNVLTNFHESVFLCVNLLLIHLLREIFITKCDPTVGAVSYYICGGQRPLLRFPRLGYQCESQRSTASCRKIKQNVICYCKIRRDLL